jgi:tRNA(Ile2) C34 agmatinyltransferase TiaS
MEDVIECDYCGGDAYYMGGLGNTVHFRCVHCGMDTSIDDAGLSEDEHVETNGEI